jgi:uncharacterized spore protein YtfJ
MSKKRKAGRARLRELLAGASGARLCYGKPVEIGDRAVIPVARVRAVGGGGGGFDTAGDARGGGGGGILDASPIGFIDVGPEGARFQSIRDSERTLRAVRSALGGASVLVASVAGVRALRRGRPVLPAPKKLLGRGR